MDKDLNQKKGGGWVLLRGWTREQRHWEDFPRSLAQEQLCGDESSACEVICLDLPGTGTELSSSSPTTIREISNDLKSRLDRLNLPSASPLGVVGISMGGMIAIDWAVRFPSDFCKIVLINSSLRRLSPPWRRLNLRLLPQLLPVLFMNDPEKIEQIILELTSSLPANDQRTIAKRFAQIRRSSPVTQFTLLKQLLAAGQFSPSTFPKIPALVITSKRDRLVDSRCSEKLAAALHAKLVTHSSAGHDIPLDAPKWLAEKIREWSNEIDLR